MLLELCILGEIISLLTVLYVDYFGTPERLFRKYNPYDGCTGLSIAAFFGGWALFPFFIYVLYKQIKINQTSRKDS